MLKKGLHGFILFAKEMDRIQSIKKRKVGMHPHNDGDGSQHGSLIQNSTSGGEDSRHREPKHKV